MASALLAAWPLSNIPLKGMWYRWRNVLNVQTIDPARQTIIFQKGPLFKGNIFFPQSWRLPKFNKLNKFYGVWKIFWASTSCGGTALETAEAADSASYFTQLFGTNSHFPKAKADKKGAHCLSKERRLYPWICQHECSTTTVGAEKKPRPTKTNIFSSTADNDKPNRLFPKMWRHTHLMNDRLSPVAKNDREKGDKECYTWVVSKRRKKSTKNIWSHFLTSVHCLDLSLL